jgi:hypothetical protein
MSHNRTAVLGMVLSVGLALAIPVAPAGARTTGKESFRGQIIAPALRGTRHVVSTIIVTKGAFAGVGKIVEIAKRPGDPGNVSRDNLVFPGGTMHIRSTSQAPQFSINQQTCAIKATIRQKTKVQGGTGMFRHASGTFAGTVRAWGVAARTRNGSCNMHADLLLDADVVSGRGTLSF